MFSAILFAGYWVILVFCLQRLTKRFLPEIPFPQLALAYGFKVALGCLYGWVFLKYFGGDDTWNYFLDSLPEYDKMIHHPAIFFQDFLPASAFREAQDSGQGFGFYLRDLEYWTMVKLLALFNVFSRGNYYIDVLFFDFITIWGLLLLFKMLIKIFPSQKTLLFILLFLIPSIQFWMSGIRAEGLLLLGMAMMLYGGGRWLRAPGMIPVLAFLFGLVLCFIFRLPFLLVWIPAFAAGMLAAANKRKPLFYFALIYGSGILVFLASLWISPEKNFASPIVQVQQKFMALHGKTRLPLDTLKSTIPGFVPAIPRAMGNVLLRPWITESRGIMQVFAAIDTMALWILILLFCFFAVGDLKKIWGNYLILVFVFYGLSQFLLIGLTVPFPGAIVRYKSIPELFLLISIGLSIDWKRIYYKFT